MKKLYAYFLFTSIVLNAAAQQDVIQSNGALFNQSLNLSNNALKANAPSISNNLPDRGATQLINKIGINPLTNNGSVNSPSGIKSEDGQALVEQEKLKDEERNQFQQFIFETTGKNIEVYGQALFRKNYYSSINQIPAPNNYVIGPGDEVDIKVWGSIDINLRQQVDRDGRITLPQVGSFGIAGTKAENLDNVLRNNIGKIYKGFQVSGTLSKISSIQVYLVGNARKPGAHTVSGMSTLVSAIFDAGGPSQFGSMRKIRLIRDGKLITQIDLYDFIKNGESSGNARLITGDVIQFPAVGKRVAMLGAIDGQAIYELSEKEDTLSDLMKFMGEENTLISQKKVLFDRIKSGDLLKNRSVEEVPFTSEGLKIRLNDGDIVTLLKINQQYSNAVTLKGNVAYPLRYKYFDGMKISDLIPEPEALIQDDYFLRKNMEVMRDDFSKSKYEDINKDSSITRGGSTISETKRESIDGLKRNVSVSLNEINWSYAVIERLDSKEIKINLIPFNLEKAVKERDPIHNIKLMAGDSVIVFSNKEIQLPQSRKNIFVKISGEVNAPGLYQMKRGETLLDLVKASGGWTSDAYLYGTSFTRESTKKLQIENLSRAINRVEADINSQSVNSIQNNLNPEMLTASQQALASQRAFLNKLKTVQPSGRMALELNPENPKYPEVVLEDGDEILIPSKPSFIGVFGSVYAESTYIHRSNATVKEYLGKAGLARESDINSVMIIRADATIESDNKNSSFFSRSVMDMKLYPGDTIFVPEAFDRRTGYTQFMQGAKDWTTILYQFGIGAAAWKTLRN